MNKTRIAVAGAGTIGHAHIDVLLNSPTCALAAIVDPSPAAQTLALQLGVPLFALLAELIAADRHTVVINLRFASGALGRRRRGLLRPHRHERQPVRADDAPEDLPAPRGPFVVETLRPHRPW